MCVRGDVLNSHIPACVGSSRRESCSTSKRRNGISAMPRQEIQLFGPFVDPIHHCYPGSTVTARLPSLSSTARFKPHLGVTMPTNVPGFQRKGHKNPDLNFIDRLAGSSPYPQIPRALSFYCLRALRPHLALPVAGGFVGTCSPETHAVGLRTKIEPPLWVGSLYGAVYCALYRGCSARSRVTQFAAVGSEMTNMPRCRRLGHQVQVLGNFHMLQKPL